MIVGLQQADIDLFKKISLVDLISLMIGYRQHLRVIGNSMEPALFEGDLILFKKTSPKGSDIKIGNIVIAIHPSNKNKLIIKRIYRIYPNGLDLRGDNVYSSTDSRQLGLLKLDKIIGIIEKIIPS